MITIPEEGGGLYPKATVLFLQRNAKWFEWSLLLLIAFCLFSIIFSMYRNGKVGFNPYLLLVCTICALVIPVSVDYTLPMLVAPLAIFLGGKPGWKGSVAKKVVSILLVLLISISYTSLLYPFKYKPYFLNNSFPALFLILLAAAGLYFLQGKEASKIPVTVEAVAT